MSGFNIYTARDDLPTGVERKSVPGVLLVSVKNAGLLMRVVGIIMLAPPLEERNRERVRDVHRAIHPVHRDVDCALALGKERRRNAVPFAADHQRARTRQLGFKDAGGIGGQFQRNQRRQRIALFQKLRGRPEFPLDQRVAVACRALDAIPLLGRILVDEEDAWTTRGVGETQDIANIFRRLQTCGDDKRSWQVGLAGADLLLPLV